MFNPNLTCLLTGQRILPVLACRPVLQVDQVLRRGQAGHGHHRRGAGRRCQGLEQQVQVGGFIILWPISLLRTFLGISLFTAH